SGKFHSLKDGVVELQTSYATMKIGKKKILSVLFPTKAREVTKPAKGSSTVVFVGGQSLTIRLKKMDTENIEAQCDFLGDVKILRKAVLQIRFSADGEAPQDAEGKAARGDRARRRAAEVAQKKARELHEKALKAKAKAIEEDAKRRKFEAEKKVRVLEELKLQKAKLDANLKTLEEEEHFDAKEKAKAVEQLKRLKAKLDAALKRLEEEKPRTAVRQIRFKK
ncbi:MAG: hypothetical protein QGD94_10245, partial [Planctomycetia bacterium]|nr:hypothetical protein [Planctomycetia bacterium]